MTKIDKRLKKLNARKVPAVALLRERGIECTGWPDRQIIERCYEILGHKSLITHVSYASLMARYTWISREMQGKRPELGVVITSAGHAAVPDIERRKFYRSADWKRVRVAILERDGSICRLCSARGDQGAIMNVDHVQPLKFHWELRLDPANLQVLCEDCNKGKGNRVPQGSPTSITQGKRWNNPKTEQAA